MGPDGVEIVCGGGVGDFLPADVEVVGPEFEHACEELPVAVGGEDVEVSVP